MTQTMVRVHLQSVVGADAERKPSPRVRQRGVCFWSSSRNEEAPGGHRRSRQGRARRETRVNGNRWSGGCIHSWVHGRARRCGADGWRRLVGVDTDHFVVPVRAHVADGQSRIGCELLLNPKRPGNERGRPHAGLNPAGHELRASGHRGSGVNGKVRDRQRSNAVSWVEGRVLVSPVTQRVLQVVVHPEAGANHRLPTERTPGQPDARLWENFGVVDRED